MDQRNEIVPVRLADGQIVQIQVTAIGSEEDIAFGILSFGEVSKAIQSIAHEVADVLSTVSPRKASVEFGLEVALESGKLTALWVKGSGTATLKITLEWGQE
jgi:hypothetical protein